MKRIWLALLVCLLLVACEKEEEVVRVTVEVTRLATSVPVTPSSTPTTPATITLPVPTALPNTPTPTPALKELTICIGYEPDTLFGRFAGYAWPIHQGIYEHLYTRLDYAYQPHGLERLPSMADGSAWLTEVVVEEGDLVVDVDDRVRILEPGMVVRNPAGEHITFTGDPITLEFLSADFVFKPMFWEDGHPVTAYDSVYAYELARDDDRVDTVVSVYRTANYTALDDYTTRWEGLPGHYDTTYFENVFRPLPRHAWGHMTVDELLEHEAVTRYPLSNGPFRVEHWQVGSHITLAKNPNYYRADEGLPYLDRVHFVFIEEYEVAIQQLLVGECDLLDYLEGSSAHLWPYREDIAGQLVAHEHPDSAWESIAFGINSAEGYGDGVGRPDWFEDKRVRQAMLLCTDRARITAEINRTRPGSLAHAYVPLDHPLMPDDVMIWPYDPAGGNALLDEAGYLDLDGDGIRQDPLTGQPFAVNFLDHGGSAWTQAIVLPFQEDMLACGIEVTLDIVSYNGFLPEFHHSQYREFDLTNDLSFTIDEPFCLVFHSDEIILDPHREHGWNISGWENAAFDAACDKALRSLPGLPDFTTGHQEALRIFMEEVPVLPLFYRVDVLYTRPGILNLNLNPTQFPAYWNLYELDIAPAN